MVLVVGAVVVVARGLWVIRSAQHPPRDAPVSILVPLIVPLYFHLFFLCMLFVAGIAMRLPALLVVSLAMLAASLAVHGWLVQQKLGIRQPPLRHSVLSR